MLATRRPDTRRLQLLMVLNSIPEDQPAEERRRSSVRRAKAALINAYGAKCMKCGTTDDLAVDHVVPFSVGGPNALHNYQLLCGPCNSQKGARYRDYRPGSKRRLKAWKRAVAPIRQHQARTPKPPTPRASPTNTATIPSLGPGHELCDMGMRLVAAECKSVIQDAINNTKRAIDQTDQAIGNAKSYRDLYFQALSKRKSPMVWVGWVLAIGSWLTYIVHWVLSLCASAPPAPRPPGRGLELASRQPL